MVALIHCELVFEVGKLLPYNKDMYIKSGLLQTVAL